MTITRLEKLRTRLKELGIEAILITQGDNRRYVSGFTGSAGALLVTASTAHIITDFRYYEQAAQQSPAFTLVKQTGQLKDAVRQAVRLSRAQTIAFESRDVSVGLHQDLADVLQGTSKKPLAKLVPVADVVEPLRMVKDEAEIAAIARAAAITDAALAGALPTFVAGMTEQQAAWEIERRMRDLGAQEVAFELIVASGPNSALPHHRPSERPLQEGEPIVIDIGARVDGYCSDMTRTVVLGKQTAKFRRIYEIVLKAHLASLQAVKAGALDKDVDAVARDIIGAAGYGKRFGHSLGHGVGLFVHEGPRLSPLVTNPQPLRPGMVVTIEPGVYLPGWGGVRIEDLVVVTENGARDLCASPK